VFGALLVLMMEQARRGLRRRIAETTYSSMPRACG
jgi:hypothetical protein